MTTRHDTHDIQVSKRQVLGGVYKIKLVFKEEIYKHDTW